MPPLSDASTCRQLTPVPTCGSTRAQANSPRPLPPALHHTLSTPMAPSTLPPPLHSQDVLHLQPGPLYRGFDELHDGRCSRVHGDVLKRGRGPRPPRTSFERIIFAFGPYFCLSTCERMSCTFFACIHAHTSVRACVRAHCARTRTRTNLRVPGSRQGPPSWAALR